MSLHSSSTANAGNTVDIRRTVERLIASRQLSYREYHNFCAVILSDNQIDEDERLQINRLFDAVQSGKLKVVN